MTGQASTAASPNSALTGGARSELSEGHVFFRVSQYALAATLEGGQAFRWVRCGEGFEGVIRGRWVRLTSAPDGIHAKTLPSPANWAWLADYLGIHESLDAILATFPDDPPLRKAIEACSGLRLLRQDPWECLASFVLSSTKQIVQIRKIIALLCERLGEPVAVPSGHSPAFAFPTAERIAAASEAELRACKMGFRARYLNAVARSVARGEIELDRLRHLPLADARRALMTLPGVGPKIADCALLFSLGFRRAFPVDVWVLRALRQLYFPRRHVTLRCLREFSETHFGPQGGYAQQYLFQHMRQRAGRSGGSHSTPS